MMEQSEKKASFITEIPLRWIDLDAYGHVNSSTYFTYFEQARIMWWETLGKNLENNNGPVVVTSSCVYLKPLFYPDLITVYLTAHSPGRSSFLIDYAIYSATKQKVAEGQTKIVWVDHVKAKSMPIPAEILKHLS